MLTWATIIFLVVLLALILTGKLLPGTILGILPIIAALAIGTGFTETLTMAHEGMLDAATVVCVFIFAVIYFSTMSDAGLFDPIIGLLVKTKGFGKTIFSVVAITGLIACVSHLDGSGVTTLMVTVPPMIVIFDKLKIKRTMMGLIFLLIIGAMNMLPWGGPLTRAAIVVGEDLMVLYKKIIPIQIVALILSFVALYIESRREEKLGEFQPADVQVTLEVPEKELQYRRPKLFWFNLILTVLLLVLLFVGLPPHLAFLIGCAIALPVNYRKVKDQNSLIKRHAGDLLTNIYTILCAGIMMGIMEGTGMFEALASSIVAAVPASLSGVVHVILGVLATPLSFLLNTDAIIYGIMPVVVNIGASYGVSGSTIAAMFVVGSSMARGLCLTTASVYLGLGMMGLEWRDAFKRGFMWSLLLGTINVLLAAVLVR